MSFARQASVLTGFNGAGKTSLLEALHYACYLKSFRTHSPYELIKDESDSFFIRVSLDGADLYPHDIQVGVSGKKRMVKVDQKSVSSYKELLEYYRVITLTEDDLALIKDGPEMRRSYLDQAITLEQPDYLPKLKKLKTCIDNRNILLKQGRLTGDMFDLWTQQVWQVSGEIRQERKAFLAELGAKVSELVAHHFPAEVAIEFAYLTRKEKEVGTYEEFYAHHGSLWDDERMLKRSLVGAHLDDFSITYAQRKSRVYASRGQQKLIVVLCKIAQMIILSQKHNIKPLFLLDDFMTDFDPSRAKTLLTLLKGLECQYIFTTPDDGTQLMELWGEGIQRLTFLSEKSA